MIVVIHTKVRMTAMLTSPRKSVIQIPRICEYGYLKWQEELCRRDLVKDLEMRRLSWIIHVGPK